IEAADRILNLISLRGTTEDILRELSMLLKEDERALAALDNLRAITHALAAMGVPTERYAVAPHLSRALSYYTGVVFETVVETPPMGSLLGGGRYDELIGAFASRPIPTVGLAFGIDRLHDVMTELGLDPNSPNVADVFITVFDEQSVGTSLQLATELRLAGFNVETALDGTEKLGKQFKYADRKGIPSALVMGPDEIAQGTVVVRNMQNGEQRSVARSEVVVTLQENHS
ncbi:MAG: His/Gly/Thr/Pro-type tRNA ligase C-terminal domain-containing protein, partial [Chloroflexota bacterium]